MNIVNEVTITALKKLEGYPGSRPALAPYRDTAGVWTNGFGNTHGVSADTPNITPEQADIDLRRNAADAASAVNILVETSLNDNQFGALVIFVFNVGITAFRKSTMLKLINQGKLVEAGQQFDRWVYIHVDGKPKVSNGLAARRTFEKSLWFTPPTNNEAAPEEALTYSSGKPVEPPNPTNVAQTSTGRAQIGALASGAAAAIIEGVRQMEPVSVAMRSALNLSSGLPSWLSVVVGALVVASMCFVGWTLWDKARKLREGGPS